MSDRYGVAVALRNIEVLDPYHRAEVRDTIAALEAELAALQARRCNGCKRYVANEYGYYCEGPDTPWFEEQPTPDFCCNRWTRKKP